MLKKKNPPEAREDNSLAAWSEVIRRSGEEFRAREAREAALALRQAKELVVRDKSNEYLLDLYAQTSSRGAAFSTYTKGPYAKKRKAYALALSKIRSELLKRMKR